MPDNAGDRAIKRPFVRVRWRLGALPKHKICTWDMIPRILTNVFSGSLASDIDHTPSWKHEVP